MARLAAELQERAAAGQRSHAIVRAIVYPISSEGRAYGRKRSDSITRLIAGLKF